MERRHLILVDEQSQSNRLGRIKQSLKDDGLELIYEEINPNDCVERSENGDTEFSEDKFKEKLQSIKYLSHLDIFATDYNLIDDEVKGIDVIKMLYEILPYYSNRVVIYSAAIEDVIENIVIKKSKNLEEQVSMLKLLAQKGFSYLKSEGDFEDKFKSLIQTEPEKSIDTRLADSLFSLQQDRFRCSIPDYTDKKISEIGEMLFADGDQSLALRRSITEHIMAYITSIRDYE